MCALLGPKVQHRLPNTGSLASSVPVAWAPVARRSMHATARKDAPSFSMMSCSSPCSRKSVLGLHAVSEDTDVVSDAQRFQSTTVGTETGFRVSAKYAEAASEQVP